MSESSEGEPTAPQRPVAPLRRRASEFELLEQEQVVVALVARGEPRRSELRAAVNGWRQQQGLAPMGHQHLAELLAKAKKKAKEIAQQKIGDMLTSSVLRYDACYTRAWDSGNIEAAVKAQTRLDQLVGLDAPKKVAQTTADGQDVYHSPDAAYRAAIALAREVGLTIEGESAADAQPAQIDCQAGPGVALPTEAVRPATDVLGVDQS